MTSSRTSCVRAWLAATTGSSWSTPTTRRPYVPAHPRRGVVVSAGGHAGLGRRNLRGLCGRRVARAVRRGVAQRRGLQVDVEGLRPVRRESRVPLRAGADDSGSPRLLSAVVGQSARSDGGVRGAASVGLLLSTMAGDRGASTRAGRISCRRRMGRRADCTNFLLCHLLRMARPPPGGIQTRRMDSSSGSREHGVRSGTALSCGQDRGTNDHGHDRAHARRNQCRSTARALLTVGHSRCAVCHPRWPRGEP